MTLAKDKPGLGIVQPGVIISRDSSIEYCGPADKAPQTDISDVIDCEGRWITPGLIDCHTHIVYAGRRTREFELRLVGASYEEIACAGGGIRSTMEATRAASVEALVDNALPRLDALLGEGVTTIEVKSGYGLDCKNELKQLQAARMLAERRHVNVRTSLLAAHALPPEYQGRSDHYIDLICEQIIPQAAHSGLADAVDAYCDLVGFTKSQTKKVFEAAGRAGLPVKLHAEQLSNMNGAQLAAGFSALSADHLEYLDEDGVKALAEADTVAVILPGAFYFLRETQLPPIDLLRKYGVSLAIATDCNPGTSPLTSILLAMNMGATLFRMSVEECLRGVTLNAARALGEDNEIGSLEVGKRCDLAIWDIEAPTDLVFNIGLNQLHSRVWGGQ